MKNPIKYLISSMDLGMEFACEDLMKLIEKVWKYKSFWKWYYRLIPIFFIIGWIWVLFNQEYVSYLFSYVG